MPAEHNLSALVDNYNKNPLSNLFSDDALTKKYREIASKYALHGDFNKDYLTVSKQYLADQIPKTLDYKKYNQLVGDLRKLDEVPIINKYRNPEQYFQEVTYREHLAFTQADVLTEMNQLKKNMQMKEVHKDQFEQVMDLSHKSIVDRKRNIEMINNMYDNVKKQRVNFTEERQQVKQKH